MHPLRLDQRQELGSHIHQGDQAQEKLRKEKETLEAMKINFGWGWFF